MAGWAGRATKVLLVEDDRDLAELLAYALWREGFTVVTAIDGEQGLQRWATERPDLVVLDVVLPGLDGVEVCRRIRRQAETPIVMVSARDAEDDVVRGLQAGADDYVTKPLSVRQLTARMRAVLRRPRAAAREVRVGDLVLDLPSHQVTKAGEPVHLTRTEFCLLHLLARNAGQVVPYARLVEHAWGEAGYAALLKAHVTHLRRKLRLPPGALVALPGVGYRLTR